MAIKQDIGVLLAKKMDRKDFLKHVGIAVIAATGFSAIVKVLAGNETQKSAQGALLGYGDSPYGGKKES